VTSAHVLGMLLGSSSSSSSCARLLHNGLPFHGILFFQRARKPIGVLLDRALPSLELTGDRIPTAGWGIVPPRHLGTRMSLGLVVVTGVQ